MKISEKKEMKISLHPLSRDLMIHLPRKPDRSRAQVRWDAVKIFGEFKVTAN